MMDIEQINGIVLFWDKWLRRTLLVALAGVFIYIGYQYGYKQGVADAVEWYNSRPPVAA
jgi:hypothetical protein